MSAKDAAGFGNVPLWVFNRFSPFARLRSRSKLRLEGDEARHGKASLSSNHATVDVTDLPITAVVAPGTWRLPTLCMCGFPMPTLNRSGSRHWSRTDCLTSRTAVYGPVRTVVWQGSLAALHKH